MEDAIKSFILCRGGSLSAQDSEAIAALAEHLRGTPPPATKRGRPRKQDGGAADTTNAPQDPDTTGDASGDTGVESTDDTTTSPPADGAGQEPPTV